MDVIHINSCPVCSGTNFKPILQCEDFLVSHQIFTLQNCKHCNFTFTQDFPSENVIGKYYDAPEYISHTDTNKGVINKLYHYARTVALNSKVSLVEKYTPNMQNPSLLDIGCGTGHFLEMIHKRGWRVSGIEKSRMVREQVIQKLHFDIEDSSYITQIPDQSKDVISLWHVLEHIENLNETMSHLYRILKDNGTLFIALPNKKSFDATYYKDKWAAYDVPRHLWHFSPYDFKKFANKHYFKIVKQKTMYFDPLYISMLSEKSKKSSFPTIQGLVKGSFFLLESLFEKSGSSSLIYVLKKQG